MKPENKMMLLLVCFVFSTLIFILSLMGLSDENKKLRERLIEQEPVIIYQADSYAGQVGIVTAKGKEETHYFVEVDVYGRFIVTKEQYDNAVVGEKADEEIFKRGS